MGQTIKNEWINLDLDLQSFAIRGNAFAGKMLGELREFGLIIKFMFLLQERETGAKRGLQKTVWVVSSLNANHNSRQSLIEDIEDATLRIQKRWSWFGRWCTCAGGLVSS